MQGLDPDPLSFDIIIHVLLQEQWGRQGDLWSGQGDPDPHVHGDTNIHYKFVVIRTYAPCTNGGKQLDLVPNIL